MSIDANSVYGMVGAHTNASDLVVKSNVHAHSNSNHIRELLNNLISSKWVLIWKLVVMEDILQLNSNYFWKRVVNIIEHNNVQY